MPKVVLTIGGSDSGGGAGIQADIKTFSALGVHGVSAITAVTAQNTRGVQRVFGLEPEAVAAQLRSIADDFCVDFAKTGMLYSAEIVRKVAEHLETSGMALVVDPVIEAEAGGRLLRSEAVQTLKEILIPLARVVTPNIFEAAYLTGVRVQDLASAKAAARSIAELGAGAVIIKGGHLDCTDLLLEDGVAIPLKGHRVSGGNHGVGCTYSAALTAFLAGGQSLQEAAAGAKEFASRAISRSMAVGRGVSPVNQAGALLEDACRFTALLEVEAATEILMNVAGVSMLIPEAGSDIGMAIPGASSPGDVAALEGGLERDGRRVNRTGCAKFAAGGRMTEIILAAMSLNPRAKAAMNLSPASLPLCRELGLRLASLDQEEVSSEADTLSRRVAMAIKEAGCVPDAILDPGGHCREPALWLLGEKATDVALAAAKLAKGLGGSDGKI